MIETDSFSSAVRVGDAAPVLASRIRSAAAQTNGARRVVRVAIPVAPAEAPLAWLRAQPPGEAFYWAARDSDRAVAAYGAADVQAIDAHPLDYDALWNCLRPQLEAASHPVRYYGGVRFDARQPAHAQPDARWAPFGTARFVLPRFTYISDGDAATLACTLVLPRDASRLDSILADLHALHTPADRPLGSPPFPVRRNDAPDEPQWTAMVRRALADIRRDALQKVVLARRVQLALEHAPDALAMLQHLADATPNCTHFAVRPGRGATWMGASPERLFRQDGRAVESEAVAGTRSRGSTARADDALRDELLASDKDRREHDFVVTAIRDALAPLCVAPPAPGDVDEMRLARRRHLQARLRGQLREGTRPVDVLEALHPTPAVAGVPTGAALTAIRRQEPFDRGWYAGPVGWVGADAAEFAVAIRSGLVHHATLALYSGAGVVAGSEPEREWDEIEQKISDFAAVLGIDD